MRSRRHTTPARTADARRLRRSALVLAVVVGAGAGLATPVAAVPASEVTAEFPGDNPQALTVPSTDETFEVLATLVGCDEGSVGQTLKLYAFGNGSGPDDPWHNFYYRPTTDYDSAFGRKWVEVPYTNPNGDGSQEYLLSFDLGVTLDGAGEPLGQVPASSTLMLVAFQGLNCINGGQSATLSLTREFPTPAPVWAATEVGPFQAGVAYSGQVAATGASSYTVSAGALPAGLFLDDTTGIISGTPTVAGPYSFSLVAQNGEVSSEAVELIGSVLPATPLDPVTHAAATVTTTTAHLTWTSTASAWEYRLADDEGWSGWVPVAEPEVTLTGLMPATPYVAEVRAVDTDGVHPSSAAASVPFTTEAVVVDPPVTDPPTTEPPVTDPPTTEPPVTEPPTTEPPVTVPGKGAGTIDLEATAGQKVAGSSAELRAWGLAPGAAYTIVLRSTPQLLASGTVEADGTLIRSVTLPTGLEPGWHSLTLTATLLDGSPLVEVLWFEITAAGTLVQVSDTAPVPTAARSTAPAGRLAATGSDVSHLIALVGMLLVTGTALVVVGGRRRAVLVRR